MTFCKCCIESWLENHSTCPISRKTLTTDQLVPNYKLRDLIDRFSKANNTITIQIPAATSQSPVSSSSVGHSAPGASSSATGNGQLTAAGSTTTATRVPSGQSSLHPRIRTLRAQAALLDVDQDTKGQILRNIAVLSEADLAVLDSAEAAIESMQPETQSVALCQLASMIDGSASDVQAVRVAVVCGLGPMLVQLLFSDDAALQSGAAAVLRLLSQEDLNKTALPVVPNALEGLVAALSSSTASTQEEEAAAALGNLALKIANRAAIAAVPKVIDRLVLCAVLMSSSEQLQLHAAQALGYLLAESAGPATIAAAPQAINSLVALLASSNGKVRLKAVSALQNLAADSANRAAIVAAPYAIVRLRKLTKSSNKHVRIHAALILSRLASSPSLSLRSSSNKIVLRATRFLEALRQWVADIQWIR
eukprot:GHUV01008844.1.p1 GENE.GHUV01008844.1~~GHUV01008844.1.p1  ORF type:complete len:487 (+),score=166.44 GHUV01008844.1:198-1463(+)